jgi:hypothetical protein
MEVREKILMTKFKPTKQFCWRSSKRLVAFVGIVLGAGLAFGVSTGSTQAAPLSLAKEMRDQARGGSPIIAVRAVVRRGGAVVGPRGGVAYRSRTVVRGPGVRPGYRGGGVRWARPSRYWWRPGGAIAAGAAVGFVTAATAVAWAGSPPAPGYCWYYTDQSRQQGFWDVCP